MTLEPARRVRAALISPAPSRCADVDRGASERTYGPGRSLVGFTRAPVGLNAALAAAHIPLETPALILPLLLSVGASSATAASADERVDAAVAAGLGWLAREQAEDGSWVSERYPASLGLTGLALLAFLADGNVPYEGEHAKVVDRALAFAIESTHPDVLCLERNRHEMYDHGLALLALAQAYGMTQRPEIRALVERGVGLTVRCQAADGGWGYVAISKSQDLSLSCMQLMGLRAARAAGLNVPEYTIEAGLDYALRNCHDPVSGGLGYDDALPRFSMTACGVVTLQACGKLAVTDPVVRGGLEYLLREKPSFEPDTQYWYYYGCYYAAQAAFQAGGRTWRELYPALVEELLAEQRADGSWEGQGEDQLMATSMAVIVLCIPKRYLPIFVQEVEAR